MAELRFLFKRRTAGISGSNIRRAVFWLQGMDLIRINGDIVAPMDK